MRIPPDASPGMRAALQEIHDALTRLGSSEALNVNLAGKRFLNAGDALSDFDFVTLRQLRQGLSETGQTARQAALDAVTGSGGGGGGGVDDGEGAAGCAACGTTGHVSSTSLTAYTAGQVVCGTGAEFPALLAPTIDQATKDANSTQLTRRMIWHLNLAGFTAGQQRNPSGVISTNKLTVSIAGVMRAYDVIVNGANYQVQGYAGMSEVFPADYVADAGIAD